MRRVILGTLLTLLLSSNVFALDQHTTQVDEVTKSTSSWDGSALPNYSEDTPEVTILRINIPAGVQLPMHKHPVINAGVLLRGELTVIREDGKTLHMKAGDSIVEVVDKWHYGKNEGSETAEIIVFYAGVVGTPITIKK
ncbi:cupin [Solemya pervernicosa gill symbiont]|uniref:Cupin n=1 Tax=Solemya pervernicosa gill symbiont TaxID=642797 RepID=A0A1T2KYW5_9GAMM|nr:cupin domain-containing protein [Solemya pervernicosa gill symbiont]OOZ38039.1 cupin [Solemya pervernicosa gill symbiont]